jgi:hypothetical protein
LLPSSHTFFPRHIGRGAGMHVPLPGLPSQRSTPLHTSRPGILVVEATLRVRVARQRQGEEEGETGDRSNVHACDNAIGK